MVKTMRGKEEERTLIYNVMKRYNNHSTKEYHKNIRIGYYLIIL